MPANNNQRVPWFADAVIVRLYNQGANQTGSAIASGKLWQLAGDMEDLSSAGEGKLMISLPGRRWPPFLFDGVEARALGQRTNRPRPY